MTKQDPNSGSAPGIPESIRHAFKMASAAGREQKEAIALLLGFGFDPSVSADLLTDEYIYAVLGRTKGSRMQ